MKCFACSNELDIYSKCMNCYDEIGAERDQLRELLMIRERKIELQVKEIELLKKLLTSINPKTVEIEPSWFVEPPVDRVELETDEYPHYDELSRKEIP